MDDDPFDIWDDWHSKPKLKKRPPERPWLERRGPLIIIGAVVTLGLIVAVFT